MWAVEFPAADTYLNLRLAVQNYKIINFSSPLALTVRASFRICFPSCFCPFQKIRLIYLSFRFLNIWLVLQGCWKVLNLTSKETSYSDRRVWYSYILFIIIFGGMLLLFVYKTRRAANEIFSPSNKIHREVGWAKDLSAPRYWNDNRHNLKGIHL